MSYHWHEVHAHLIEQTARADFQQQYRAMTKEQRGLSGFTDPSALLGFLHGSNGTGVQKNDVLRALVVEAQSGARHARAANSLVVLALWPGLGALRNRLLRFFRNDPDLLTAELTGRLSHSIATTRLDRVTWIAATLLRNIERDIRRVQRRDAQATGTPLDDDCPELARWPSHPRGNVLASLRRHIGADAELVMAVAVFGFSQKEAARALGLSYEMARKRYQRAMARLVAIFDLSDL